VVGRCILTALIPFFSVAMAIIWLPDLLKVPESGFDSAAEFLALVLESITTNFVGCVGFSFFSAYIFRRRREDTILRL